MSSKSVIENAIDTAIGHLARQGMVVCCDKRGVYQVIYDEKAKEQKELFEIIPWNKISKNREAVRELMSVLVDHYFDD